MSYLPGDCADLLCAVRASLVAGRKVGMPRWGALIVTGPAPGTCNATTTVPPNARTKDRRRAEDRRGTQVRAQCRRRRREARARKRRHHNWTSAEQLERARDMSSNALPRTCTHNPWINKRASSRALTSNEFLSRIVVHFHFRARPTCPSSLSQPSMWRAQQVRPMFEKYPQVDVVWIWDPRRQGPNIVKRRSKSDVGAAWAMPGALVDLFAQLVRPLAGEPALRQKIVRGAFSSMCLPEVRSNKYLDQACR